MIFMVYPKLGALWEGFIVAEPGRLFAERAA